MDVCGDVLAVLFCEVACVLHCAVVSGDDCGRLRGVWEMAPGLAACVGAIRAGDAMGRTGAWRRIVYFLGGACCADWIGCVEVDEQVARSIQGRDWLG